jgi:DNA (cytosine-5)-methyltransferase 1
MRLLDLFCGAGGASKGYADAGFEVVGIDIEPQPHYRNEFHQADAVTLLSTTFVHKFGFDAVHASPPCQAYTNAQKIRGNDHPELVDVIRDLLLATGLPYIIENVPGAPLESPITLCGTMFGLPIYRHRLFETNFPLEQPLEASHQAEQVKMGRRPRDGQFIQVVGHFTDVAAGRKAMGIDWMTRDELAEAIPPAYTEWIGRQLVAHLDDPFRKSK